MMSQKILLYLVDSKWILREKIIIIAITSISLAVLGTTSITSFNVQETFAIKENCSDNDNCWCYESQSALFCFNNKDDCNKRQMSDISGTSGCFKRP
jgi:hypothetical protein